MDKVITDANILKTVCEPITDMKDGEYIANKLFKRLTEGNSGVGLSAPQLGIFKRVCVIKVNKPIYLINPRIIESEGEIIFLEQCLSFPKTIVRTKRFASITVEADNFANKLYFDGSGIPLDEIMSSPDALECIVAQHEISHLDGKTMYDYEYKLMPRKVDIMPGRNDKIEISNGLEVISVKFKHLNSYLEKGWKEYNKI